MMTIRYTVDIATTDRRADTPARLAAELYDAVRLRFGSVQVSSAPPAPAYPPGSCEETP